MDRRFDWVLWSCACVCMWETTDQIKLERQLEGEAENTQSNLRRNLGRGFFLSGLQAEKSVLGDCEQKKWFPATGFLLLSQLKHPQALKLWLAAWVKKGSIIWIESVTSQSLLMSFQKNLWLWFWRIYSNDNITVLLFSFLCGKSDAKSNNFLMQHVRTNIFNTVFYIHNGLNQSYVRLVLRA